MSTPLIEIKDLTVYLSGELVLDRVSFTLNEGEFLAIVGPNGAGKTTLLRSIVGLVKPTSGTIKIRDDITKRKKGTVFGYLPQEFSLKRDFPLRVIDVVLLSVYPSLPPFSFPGEKEKKRAREYLELMGVEELENSFYSELSGGQKQRVQIARALMNDPPIILLDEPRTGIDVVGQENFYSLIAKIKHNRGILMVSHDIGVVSKYCDNVACLNRRLICHIRHSEITDEILKELYKEDIKGLIHDHFKEN